MQQHLIPEVSKDVKEKEKQDFKRAYQGLYFYQNPKKNKLHDIIERKNNKTSSNQFL